MKYLITSCAILLYCIYLAECYNKARNEVCYEAKTCIHNGEERCGVTSAGKYRKFLDSCDILEYNCLKGTDYTKTKYGNCKDLPPVDDQIVDEVQWPKEDEGEHDSQQIKEGKGLIAE